MSLARFALADLRAAWRQWVGAFVVLVTTAAALTCAVAIVVTADTLPARGLFPMNSSLGSLAGMNAGIVAVVGVVMVRNVVDQIVAQRRRAMAAWMLVGLLPRQVAIVVASQGVVVAMAAAVASTPLGVGAAYLALGALAGTVGAPAPPLVARPSALILPVLLLLGVTLLALRRPCRRAIRVDPALALRDDVDVEARRLSVWRVIIALLAAAGSVVGVAAAASAAQPDAAGGAVLGVLAAAALLLSALGPVLAVGVHRAWTALLPDRLVGWWLARSGQPDRLGASGQVALVEADPQPSVELEADPIELPGSAEAEPFMQCVGGRVGLGDHADDHANAVGGSAECLDRGIQGTADAAAAGAFGDIDGPLAGESVCRARPERGRIGEADDVLAVAIAVGRRGIHGDNHVVAPAGVRELVQPALWPGRGVLEGGYRMQDGGVVDGRDARRVRGRRRTHEHVGHRSRAARPATQRQPRRNTASTVAATSMKDGAVP
jgi:hypothetical protein